MYIIRKYVLLFVSSFALSCLLILSLSAKYRNGKKTDEGFNKNLPEKLKESKIALDKAALAVQNTLDAMKAQVS